MAYLFPLSCFKLPVPVPAGLFTFNESPKAVIEKYPITDRHHLSGVRQQPFVNMGGSE